MPTIMSAIGAAVAARGKAVLRRVIVLIVTAKTVLETDTGRYLLPPTILRYITNANLLSKRRNVDNSFSMEIFG